MFSADLSITTPQLHAKIIGSKGYRGRSGFGNDMKRVLIIKMSSMGDVIHALPALTDAMKAHPGITFDWVVEPGFSEIPRWHHAVNNVITIPMRRWRKEPWQAFKNREWKTFLQKLRNVSYDAVIDAQGLAKSALITCFTKGIRIGPDFHSAREAIASLVYQRKVTVDQQQHAVERMRKTFAQALNYPLPETPPDYGIDRTQLAKISYGNNCLVFLHGTTWTTKHWPEIYWQQLGYLASAEGYQVLLPWGSEAERERAERIRGYTEHKDCAMLPIVLPKMALAEITALISQAKGVVAVDTGLGHIAAAMGAPTVSLYGPTDPGLTGAYGPSQLHLHADLPCAPCLSRNCKIASSSSIMPPCFETLPPKKVWNALQNIMQPVNYAV